MWARRPAEPSLSTIAPPRWQPPAGAMCAIVWGELNDDVTQHRPEHAARTDAPGHTRTALPGSSTGHRRKIVPVRRNPEHEDENGHAAARSCVTGGADCVADVPVGVAGVESCAPSARAVVCARALRSAWHKSAHPISVAAHAIHRPTINPALPSILTYPRAVVYVAAPNHVGSRNQATHTIASPSSIHVRQVEGPTAGVPRGNLDASRNHGTPVGALFNSSCTISTRAQGIEAGVPSADLVGNRK